MSRVYVELSGESPELARAEALATARALGGRPTEDDRAVPGLLPVDLPTARVVTLADRLALARRCLVAVEGPSGVSGVASYPRGPGASAAFRRLGRPSGGGADAGVHAAATAWKAAGGTIDLERPTHRFWLSPAERDPVQVYEELAAVDRAATARRRISALPFQRPVGLPPRLARVAANLAGIIPGSRVVDPFLGTGALLAEAALLGGRVAGIDRDPAMVRGALRNFEHLGVVADHLVVGDAAEVDFPGSGGPFDALLTDPPYGRASSAGGTDPTELLRKVLPRWAARVEPAGAVVVIVPGGPDPLPAPWKRSTMVPVRVHRSLTREFRVYRRSS